jgi:hypothetical protein
VSDFIHQLGALAGRYKDSAANQGACVPKVTPILALASPQIQRHGANLHNVGRMVRVRPLIHLRGVASRASLTAENIC